METILDGARHLLDRSLELLEGAADEVILVGGWGPYLRNPEVHPGTKDVDILFPPQYDRDDIRRVIERFTSAGFVFSAKHDFQLFLPIDLLGKTFIFNVDLLHPVIQRTHKAEFIDIIDLGITIDGTLAKTVQTIGIAGGEILFEAGLCSPAQLNGFGFRTLSPTGVVLSKLQSCHNPKRPRDIFDILLSLREDPDAPAQLAAIGRKWANVATSLDEYRTRLRLNWKFYVECLLEFESAPDASARDLLSSL